MAEYIMKEETDMDGVDCYIRKAELIRCRDCKYYHSSFCEVWSKYGTIQTRESGYCYMAERREDG